MSSIDLSKFKLRTDLIIENNQIEHIENNIDGLTITKTKNKGNYVTISFEDITNFESREVIGKHLEIELKEILKINNIKDSDSCLIIGLGNALSTPDSLGVKSLKNIIVTAHLFKIKQDMTGMRKVYTFTPGVMANTGIETSEIIISLIKQVKPNFAIAIDALASTSVERINKTIQITDTGIHPGSGIGNNRKEISKNTLGIPVIAIGVPTVVLSSTIVYNTINYLYKHISYIKEFSDINKLTYNRFNYKKKLQERNLSKEDKENLLGLFGTLTDIEQQELIDEVLNQTELNLIVTPTEIDFLIDKISNVISSSLNNALHRQITHY